MPLDIPAEIRRAKVDEIIDLRHVILRNGLPREAAIFDGDETSAARHYAADFAGQIVGCATLHLNRYQDRPAWQLRGMATSGPARGKGVGRALLEFLEADLLADANAARQLWCNARVPAAGFYQKLGWMILSGEFDIPTAGPHYQMAKLL